MKSCSQTQKMPEYSFYWINSRNIGRTFLSKFLSRANIRDRILVFGTYKKLYVCSVIKVRCPVDMNISSNYWQMLRNLQLLYPNCKFTFMWMIISALGFMNKCLGDIRDKLGFPEKQNQLDSSHITITISKWNNKNMQTFSTVKRSRVNLLFISIFCLKTSPSLREYFK